MKEYVVSASTPQPLHPAASEELEVRALYHQVLEGWNQRGAAAFAAPFAEDGDVIGFDGSEYRGRAAIVAALEQVFADHRPPAYVSIVRSVRCLSPDVVILRAVVGMALPGQSAIEPTLNARQTLVAARSTDVWRIVLFQTTPAQLHGRPDLARQLTEELQQLLA
jgi:uncharacterized protein (TIGR02246 family)